MELSIYLSGLLKEFNDRRTIRNINDMVRKIIENKSIRLWTNAQDKACFEREKRLIDGSLKSVLDNEKISNALRNNSLGSLGDQERLLLLHDPCDIRKQYSRELENLGKVRSLDNEIINGYRTFNTVGIDIKGKKIRPVDISIYSNGDEHHITQEELKQHQKGILQTSGDEKRCLRGQQIQRFVDEGSYVNLLKVTRIQLERIGKGFKQENPRIILVHVLDREFDGNGYFEFIDKELGDEFVIRLKTSRNSNESAISKETQQEQAIKLKDVVFENQELFSIGKLIIKNKVYQNVTRTIEWGKYSIRENQYSVVRITLTDRKGKKIFKAPMLLITNIPVKKAESALSVYRIYLMRSKIEGTFKFLKNALGWEEFQVRDYESIKNIIALCYFIGGYFYEIESELTKNHTMQTIAKLGGGKGKVTRHYFFEGLKKILIHQRVEHFININRISSEELTKMLALVA